MRQPLFALFALVCSFGWACGGGADCPPDYPIERDGYCYRADDGGLVGMDGGTASDAAPPDGSAGSDGAVADGGDVSDGGPAECTGVHPNVMGMRRYCDPGACYCGDMAMALDVCYPAAVADTCCPVDVVCEPGTDGGTVMCTGTHPIVSGTMRTCDPGNCYCGSAAMGIDSCYPAAVADECCPVATVCY